MGKETQANPVLYMHVYCTHVWRSKKGPNSSKIPFFASYYKYSVFEVSSDSEWPQRCWLHEFITLNEIENFQ